MRSSICIAVMLTPFQTLANKWHVNSFCQRDFVPSGAKVSKIGHICLVFGQYFLDQAFSLRLTLDSVQDFPKQRIVKKTSAETAIAAHVRGLIQGARDSWDSRSVGKEASQSSPLKNLYVLYVPLNYTPAQYISYIWVSVDSTCLLQYKLVFCVHNTAHLSSPKRRRQKK